MKQRLGAPEEHMLVARGNLANSYQMVGRLEECLSLRRDVYSGRLKLYGEEHRESFADAFNYATSLVQLKRYEEVKSLLRKVTPVARRVLGENDELTLRMRGVYAQTLYIADDATLDDLREAVTTLEETVLIARRVLGSTHPLTTDIEDNLRRSRAVLRASDKPSTSN